MPEISLLKDLSVIMVVAAFTTVGCHLLKQPVVIGYLLAGFIIGPHTPPFSLINDLHSIETLAEIGLVFLMFAVGLEFNLPKLRRVGVSASLAAILEIISMVGIGYWLGIHFGWSKMDSVFLGLILSMSSTTIIAKVFNDLKLAGQEFAQVVFGILILEDLMAIGILALLSGLGVSQIAGVQAVTALGQVAFFVVLFLVVGLAVVPKLLKWIGRFGSKELLGIVVLGLCLASALLASKLGFSVALGAFMMGSIVGVSSEIETIESWIHPIRDMFSAIFFVATGLLLNPQLIMQYKWEILAVALVTIVGKVLSGAVGAFLAGYGPKTAFKTGMSLAQIGEFSFVFAALALKSKKGSDFLYPVAVTVSVLTSFTTPYLIQRSDKVVATLLGWVGDKRVDKLLGYHRWLERISQSQSGILGFLSKYIVRLIIYAVLYIALVSLMSLAAMGWKGSWILHASGWLVGFWFLLPLIAALATYFSHFVLIVFTEILPRIKAGKLLEFIPIQGLYAFLYDGALIIFSVIFWLRVSLFLPSWPFWVTMGTGMVSAFLLKRRIAIAYERCELVMDEILGLTTSEPLRQAALKVHEGGGLLENSIEQLPLRAGDHAVHQSIRSLDLRQKTGASLIGIYRKGAFIPNPSPTEELQPHDTLVLLGDQDERLKARELLKAQA